MLQTYAEGTINPPPYRREHELALEPSLPEVQMELVLGQMTQSVPKTISGHNQQGLPVVKHEHK